MTKSTKPLRYINDGVTVPKTNSVELCAALKTIRLHMVENEPQTKIDLGRALVIMRRAEKNRNWVMYVP